ncbi:MAG: CpaD family pilus assembly protein [Sphingomonas sp.]|jgi:pilus assembly protein CpaD|uniref:CpaD family pilus assembly protein n=1 Tax=Sphingomonas sp. TaxID=28214 RepID=UPI003565491D
MNMYKRVRVIAIGLLPALALSACGGTENRGLESVHQPVVSRTDYAIDVATSPNGLAPGEAQRLAGWMASLRLGYGDQVAIEDASTNSGAVRDDVAREVSHYGLLVSDDTPLTGAPVAAGMARVVISRMKATVPGCPDFSRSGASEFESNTSSNHGCAINANLAAMVANPADLVRGQTSSGVGDQATSGKAIDSYRKASPTGGGGTVLKTEKAGAGKQ